MKHDLDVTLDELVKQLRERAGISQAELARRVGVSPGTIGRVEAGTLSMGPENLQRLAEALDVSNGDRKRLAKARDRASERLSTRKERQPTELGPRAKNGAKLVSLPTPSEVDELEELRRRLDEVAQTMADGVELGEDLSARVSANAALTDGLAERLSAVEARLRQLDAGGPAASGT